MNSEKKLKRNDNNKQGERKKTKKSPFADADEYEKLLEEELKNQPRENDDESDSSVEEVKSSQKKKTRHK